MGGSQGRSGRVRKISPPPGFDPRTVQPVASGNTDWAIPAYHVAVVPVLFIQGVPLAIEPGISLIILTPMKILQRNLNRSTFVVWEMWQHHNMCWKWPPFASRQDWTRRAIFLESPYQYVRRHCLNFFGDVCFQGVYGSWFVLVNCPFQISP